VRHVDAARLAAEGLALVDVDAEAALDQLMRRGQARHAATEDGHALAAQRRRHARPSPRCLRLRCERPAQARGRGDRGGVLEQAPA